ncbi:MAG TPA: hypothetical protein PKY19_07130 [Oscillospiraceae bacterium]|nr:hypothetical protein [Oscillospiraceae bacterium]
MKPLGKALDEFRIYIAGQKMEASETIGALIENGQSEEAAVERAKVTAGDIFLAYLQQTEKAHGREGYADFVKAYAEALAPQIADWKRRKESAEADDWTPQILINTARLDKTEELLTVFTDIMENAQEE